MVSCDAVPYNVDPDADHKPGRIMPVQPALRLPSARRPSPRKRKTRWRRERVLVGPRITGRYVTAALSHRRRAALQSGPGLNDDRNLAHLPG